MGMGHHILGASIGIDRVCSFSSLNADKKTGMGGAMQISDEKFSLDRMSPSFFFSAK